MALRLNGSTSKLSWTGAIFGATYPFSMLIWVNPASGAMTANGWAVAAGESGTAGDELGIQFAGADTGDPVMAVARAANSGDFTCAVSPIVQGAWKPALAVFTSTTSRTIYYDGKTQTSTASRAPEWWKFDRFLIGERPSSGASRFNGDVAMCCVWGAALTAEDYAALLTAADPTTVKTANVIEYWPLTTQAATQTGINGRVLTATDTVQAPTEPTFGGDTTAPTLTSPTATATGTTTASGTVSTNEANGTLYYLASTNASEDATTVKAASSQAVSATGSQSVSFTGLAASTTYYAHYVHRDAAGNDSAVASSASFTTSAPSGDTTPPTLTGSITISALTTTSYTATWPAGSDNVAVTGYEYRIASGSWIDAGNVLTVNITGRTPGATETFEVRAYDAAGNRSTPALSTSVTLLSVVPTVTVTEPLKNNTGTLLASQSGITVAVLQAADLVSIYEATGLTTNASGLLAAISNASITTGQQYHVAIKLADGGVGITGPITAS